MLDVVLLVIIIALVVDGIKMVIESTGRVHSREANPSPEEVTVVMAAYNEPAILSAISSLTKIANHIIVVDDASTDGTSQQLLGLTDAISKKDGSHIDININTGQLDSDTKFTLITSMHNRGKVFSLHRGLAIAATEYVFICDADIYLDDSFELPVNLLNEKMADAVCFSVLPAYPLGGWISRLLYKLQYHEYMKSMQIGRRFADRSKSVECVSGAAGLFRTSRLKELSGQHSMVWQGEDLERTLIELYNDGEVVFSDQIIYTEAPETLWDLTKQRVTGWWGGMARLFPLFGRLIFKKGSPARLRFEGAYNILSMLVDPVKLVMLWILIFSGSWVVLAALYGVYVLLESYLYMRCRKRITPDKPFSYWPVLLYPVYGLLQLHYRVAAYLYMIGRKVSGNLRPLRYITGLVLLLLAGQAQAQDVTYDGSIGQYEFNESIDMKYNVYLGVDNYYIQYHQGLYEQVNVGGYLGNFLIDVGARTNAVIPTLQYNKWIGNSVVRAKVRYSYLTDNALKPKYENSTLVGIGVGHYAPRQSLSIELLKQLDRYKSWVLVGKTEQQLLPNASITLGGSIDDQWDYSAYGRLQFHFIYGYADYKQNYDYSGYDYRSVGAGIQLKFN